MDEVIVENQRLRSALKIANANHERFEREWYLRGDEIERLLSEIERMREALRLIMAADEMHAEFGLIDAFGSDDHPEQSPFLAHALALARSALSEKGSRP